MTAVSAALIGLGVHGSALARLLPAAGVAVRGAADPGRAGTDLHAITGAESTRGIEIVADVEDLDWSTGYDIAILAAKVPLDTLADISTAILSRGTDVLTISEEAFDLARTNPAVHARIHDAALAHSASFVATGSQDVLWTGLVLQMTSQVLELQDIEITTHIGVDGYPAEFLTWCGIGNSPSQFHQTAAEAGESPSVFGSVLPVIAEALGWHVTEESREMQPYTLDRDLPSVSLRRSIPAGSPAGRCDVVQLRTAEGPTLRAELVTSAVMGEDSFTARLTATPSVEMTYRLEPQHLSVNAAVVNRIPDVLAAPPGVVATVDLPAPRYRSLVHQRDLEPTS